MYTHAISKPSLFVMDNRLELLKQMKSSVGEREYMHHDTLITKLWMYIIYLRSSNYTGEVFVYPKV